MVVNVDDINQEIFALWKLHVSEDMNALAPLVYSPIQTDSLLYIGLNPSFSANMLKLLTPIAPAGIDTATFFLWRNQEQFDFHIAQTFEQRIRDKYHTYFKKLRDLADELRLPWDHIDLFFCRETKQTNLKTLLGIEKQNVNLTVFGMQQLVLATKLIERARPRIIVVANALASRLFTEKYPMIFDQAFGYHRTQIAGRNVPTFFSSPLTGVRALDNFSFERLKWHISKAKEEQLT
ncbi:MAG: hypothetical protein ACOYOS_24005 [Syntrophales bacterium]